MNMVGGQDELVFDGGSLVIDSAGDLVAAFPVRRSTRGRRRSSRRSARAHAASSRSHLARASRRHRDRHPTYPMTPQLDRDRRDLRGPRAGARRLRAQERVREGRPGTVRRRRLGTRGDDRADALGAGQRSSASRCQASSRHRIRSTTPRLSPTTSASRCSQIPIKAVPRVSGGARRGLRRCRTGLAEENLQARIRGTLLMAISNRYGHLVIATGNKSEMACGYATLYGDMAGGFALIRGSFQDRGLCAVPLAKLDRRR